MALGAERRSMTFALHHMEELGLTGGVLHVNGKIAALHMGPHQLSDMGHLCGESEYRYRRFLCHDKL